MGRYDLVSPILISSKRQLSWEITSEEGRCKNVERKRNGIGLVRVSRDEWKKEKYQWNNRPRGGHDFIPTPRATICFFEFREIWKLEIVEFLIFRFRAIWKLEIAEFLRLDQERTALRVTTKKIGRVNIKVKPSKRENDHATIKRVRFLR